MKLSVDEKQLANKMVEDCKQLYHLMSTLSTAVTELSQRDNSDHRASVRAKCVTVDEFLVDANIRHYLVFQTGEIAPVNIVEEHLITVAIRELHGLLNRFVGSIDNTRENKLGYDDSMIEELDTVLITFEAFTSGLLVIEEGLKYVTAINRRKDSADMILTYLRAYVAGIQWRAEFTRHAV